MITITPEFREKVDKAARSVAGSSNVIEWEDLSQEMWVWMLENPNQYDNYIQLEDPFRELKKIAKQEMYKANNAWEWYSGQYTYTPGEVRGLLNEYLIDVTIEAISEHVDLVEGLLLLRDTNSSYFKVLVDKHVHGIEPRDAKYTQRSVDKLTEMMNQVNRAARYSYEGPGSRRIMTNSQAQARTE